MVLILWISFYLGVLVAPKSYFVTNWKTGEVNEIIYRGSFEKFVLQIGVSFRMGGKRRLYALKPGVLLEEKVRIRNKSELEEICDYIDENEEILEALQVLYIYPEDASPQSSPTKTPVPYHEEEYKAESSSGKNESVKSDRSTYQNRFAREVARRDENKCLLCGETHALEGAHIVDVKAKLTTLELRNLGIHNKYEVWNGILLCAVCHHKYDHWQHGIDKDGFLWKKNGQWIKDEAVNIYPSPEFKTKRQYPDPNLLDWKFERFLLNRNNVIARITYGITSLFVTSPTKGRK